MNQLEVSIQKSIIVLAGRGWSRRRIARELGIHRETVGRYLAVHEDPRPAIVPIGSTAVLDSKPAIPPLGSAADSISKPAMLPIESQPDRKSQCEPFADVIQQAWTAVCVVLKSIRYASSERSMDGFQGSPVASRWRAIAGAVSNQPNGTCRGAWPSWPPSPVRQPDTVQPAGASLQDPIQILRRMVKKAL